LQELYEARLNRTLWQIVYEFDRERAEAALEHLRQIYGEPEGRLWERHDELYLTWLGFRLADEFEAYLKSGVGRGLRTKEEVAGAVFMPWLPADLAPLFWLRLVGDPEGGAEFRNAWYTAADMWFERMAAPYTPKKPAVARKAVELFNAFVGAGFKYEELFPPPPPKPEAQKPEAAKPAETKKEAVKPETAKTEAKPAQRPEAAKPETVKPAQKPVTEVQKLEERGLRREEKPAVKPEAAGPVGQKPPAVTAVEEAGRGLRQEAVKPAKPEAVKPAETKPAERPAVEAVEEHGLRREAVKPEAVKPAEAKPAEVKKEAVKPEAVKPAAETVEARGLRREEKLMAPIADVIPERVVEAVDYLIGRFGFVLDREAAFKAKSLVTAKVQARLEKVVAKEPEFAHILAEAAEHVLYSFGRLMASPDAARHVHDALFYYFEGYQTRDGELLFARIERTVREAVKKAEEAGIPDADYRVKQFILEIIDILATAGERYRRDALRAVSTVEKALRVTALTGLSAAALYSVYHGLYSEAVVSSVATAVAFVEVGRFKEAVEYVQRAAKTLYETAKEVFEHVKVTVQRLIELFVEAGTRALAWVDEHKAYLFLTAAVTAGAITLSTALNLWGLVELEKLAYAAVGASFVAAGVKVDERKVAEVVRLAEGALGKTPTLVPGGGALSAEVERWVAGLRSGEVKAAVARAAEELEKWLGAVKGGRYADHSSGRAARICAGGVCAAKTRRWAIYFRPVRVEAGKAGEAKEKWIVAKSPEELETWLSGAGSAYVAPALFFAGGKPELRVVTVSEAVVVEVGRRLEAVRGAGGVQYDALAASAKHGVLTAAKVGDVARMWKAYIDGVESYLTDPAKQEELRREAERWIKALRLNTTAEEAVARGLEMLKTSRDTGLFNALRAMAQRLGEASVESVEKMLKTLEGGEFWLETTPTGKTIKICGERCVSVDQRGVYAIALEGLSAEVQIPRLLPEEYVKRLHIGWLASDESREPHGFALMYTTQLWQLYAWLITKSGRTRIHAPGVVLKRRGVSIELATFPRDLRLVSGGSTLSVAENGRVVYQIPLEGRDIKTSTIKLVLEHLDAGDPLPLVAYYLGDGVVERGILMIAVSRKRMHLFEGRDDVSVDVKRKMVVFRLVSELYVRAVAELYLSGVGVLFDVLHSHKWLAFKRLAAENLVGFPLAGQCVKLSSVKGLRGRVLFRTKGEAERYAETARRELEKLGIYAAPKVTSGINHQVVFDEKTLRRLAKVDEAVKQAIERLEILSTPRIAAKAIDAALQEERTKRLAKPKIETKHEELPRPVEPKAAERREEMPKTTAPKTVDRVVFQLVDGVASMKLRLTYVMKGDRKIPTINAVTRFSALEEAEEFRRQLRLSGINASVISKGAYGFEVTVPKDELEKLTPEEKEAIKQYLEHVTQTRDEEKKKAAEEVLHRFDFSAKAVNIGGIRLGLVHKKGKGVRAEKYGNPQLIAEIKTALERKLRKILGDEYEQWKNQIKTTEGGRRLVIRQQLLQRLKQNPNTTKLNEKT
jgi:hypothetical protein